MPPPPPPHHRQRHTCTHAHSHALTHAQTHSRAHTHTHTHARARHRRIGVGPIELSTIVSKVTVAQSTCCACQSVPAVGTITKQKDRKVTSCYFYNVAPAIGGGGGGERKQRLSIDRNPVVGTRATEICNSGAQTSSSLAIVPVPVLSVASVSVWNVSALVRWLSSYQQ